MFWAIVGAILFVSLLPFLLIAAFYIIYFAFGLLMMIIDAARKKSKNKIQPKEVTDSSLSKRFSDFNKRHKFDLSFYLVMILVVIPLGILMIFALTVK